MSHADPKQNNQPQQPTPFNICVRTPADNYACRRRRLHKRYDKSKKRGSPASHDYTHVIHVAEKVTPAPIGAYRLPGPNIPVEAVENHEGRDEQPNPEADVAVHPAVVLPHERRLQQHVVATT